MWGTPEAEKLQPVDAAKTVPADVYNAALAMVKAKEDSINENYVPLIKQLQAELEQLRANDHSEELQQKITKQSEENAQYITERDEWQRKTNYYAEQVGQTKILLDEQITCRDEAQQQVSELQAQLQAAAAAQEQPKEEYPVSIGLVSGGEFDYMLPACMAEIMIKEIQQPRHLRSTCAQYVDGRLVDCDHYCKTFKIRSKCAKDWWLVVMDRPIRRK